MKRILCVMLAAVLLLSGCTAAPMEPAETAEPVVTEKPSPEGPVSGKYCVLGVDGERTYPERTALKFDFDTMGFNFGFPGATNAWIRVGTLEVEGSRVTAVCTSKHKTEFVGDELKTVGDYVWIFEFEDDGNVRFIPEGSDVFEVYGTQLSAESVLVRIGDLDEPLEWHIMPSPEADTND